MVYSFLRVKCVQLKCNASVGLSGVGLKLNMRTSTKFKLFSRWRPWLRGTIAFNDEGVKADDLISASVTGIRGSRRRSHLNF